MPVILMKYQIEEVADGSVIMMKIMLAASEDEEENDDECGEGGVEAEWNCNHVRRWIGHLLRHSPLPATPVSCCCNQIEQL